MDRNDFFEQVYAIVRLIPEGRVTSYGAIARCLGAAQSSRMVGYAMNHSHTSSVPVPAHRVVNRNGLLTGKHHFETPDEMKRLLGEEGVAVQDDRIMEFEKRFWDPIKEITL
jgi:methylated-DNA-protein-cysteine methyltransferase related protein